ncbi:MAG: YbfB/YjiJ family MFS transporter [Desulfobulbaceae bacterium]|nr:YbfB/YjiJ family MFS transporter [Desulfobulbaceae bacterium]
MGKYSYRWVIVLAGIAGLFASLGLGRFSLGMMLPSMGEALALTYSQMGLISTVNFCGYLMAVLLCGILTARLGERLLISVALTLVALSMVLVGFSSHYLLILLLYFLTGVGSALSNVPIMALITVWFDGRNRGRAAGLCVMGNGLGILVTGKGVPLLNKMADGWRVSWVVLGCLVGCIAVLCFFLFRNRPKEDEEGPTETVTTAAAAVRKTGSVQKVAGKNIFYHCGVIYFLFGCTYVIYVTFFVTALVQERGLSEQAAGSLWSWVGLLSLVSGPLFGYLSDIFGRKTTLAAVFFIQTTAYLLAAVKLPMFSVYISLGCFGLVAWSIPSIIAALVGDHAGPERTAAMFGFVTFLFGVGQIIGPACAGFLAEQSGSFSISFLLAAVLAGVAIVLSLLLPGKEQTLTEGR